MKNQYLSIGQLATMAGVSTRTIRHYESEQLLKPQRQPNGYRAYTEADARRLAHILSMRACGLSLSVIRTILSSPQDEMCSALQAHLSSLQQQKENLNKAMAQTEKALAAAERMKGMSTKKAFEQVKAQELENFEAQYGKEARARYGNTVIEATNKRIMELSQDEWNEKQTLEQAIKEQLACAMKTGDPQSEEARELTLLHEKWIRIHWGEGYTTEAHLALAQGYLGDDRFVQYYDDAAGSGATEFLVRALKENLS